MLSLMSNRRFLAVALGHFVVDGLTSAVPLIVTILSLRLGLSDAGIGWAVGIYTAVIALSQPFFGYWGDRWNGRLLAAGGVAWMVFFFLLSGLAPTKLVIPTLVVAALGSGAFHPQGAANAAYADLDHRSTATATFFLFGRAGFTLMPLIAGILFTLFDTHGLLAMTIFFTPVPLLLWRWLPDHVQSGTVGEEKAHSTKKTDHYHHLAVILSLFALLIIARYSAMGGIRTFIPKYYQLRGWSAAQYGALSSFFMLGGAVGGFLGGVAADRFGIRPVVIISMLLAGIAAYIFPAMTVIWKIYLFVGLTGFMLDVSHSLLVLIAQSLVAGWQSLASGLILGFMFIVRAGGAIALGILADRFSLAFLLPKLGFFFLIAAFFALFLPVQQKSTMPVAATGK